MRTATVRRKTNETDIDVRINLDGTGTYKVSTTIPFLDHMLSLCAFHGGLNLMVKAKGDTEVDYHHLMEDMGIALGEVIGKALADRKGIRRYGNATVPMDEALARVVVDISGRPYLVYKMKSLKGSLKDLEVSLFEDFFRAFTSHAMITLHITAEYGRDRYHIIEAVFKAFGQAMRDAVTIDPKTRRLPSTKGKL